jgi:transposase
MGEVNRYFSPEFKINAVWKGKYLKLGERAFKRKGKISAEQAEIRKLRKDLERVKEERDILKKALATFSKEKE